MLAWTIHEFNKEQAEGGFPLKNCGNDLGVVFPEISYRESRGGDNHITVMAF